jgi:hypothetical protein
VIGGIIFFIKIIISSFGYLENKKASLERLSGKKQKKLIGSEAG